MSTSLPRVGWVGLGAMGAPMATCLARAGYEIVAYDLDPTRAREAGVTPAATVAEALETAHVAVIMVATPGQAASVLFDPGGALDSLTAGSTVIVTATVGPDAIAAWESRLAAAGIALVDAPVSGGTRRAAAGDLLVMASGHAAAIETALPLLDAMAGSVALVGPDPGDGQKVKLVNQLLCGIHIAAAAEALAFAEALGLDAGRCFDAVRHGAAASFMLEDRGPRMLVGAFEPAHGALDLFVKDLGLVTETAGRLGYAAPLAAAAEQRYLAGHDAGLGGFDDSVLIEVARKTAPTAGEVT